MKRYMFSALCMVIVLFSVYSQPVSKDMALTVALHALNDGKVNTVKIRQKVASLKSTNAITTFSQTGQAELYKVNTSGKTVFMTTDMRMPAIIAHIEGNVTDISDLPPAFLDYLALYEEEMDEIRKSNSVATINSEWLSSSMNKQIRDTIGPLMVRNGQDHKNK